VAGFQGQLFSDSFIAAVFDHSKGVARKINNLCRGALLLGATEGKQILDETDLKRVLRDLEGQLG
jgi:type II secretory pathway predicted ATPase ExeA